MKELTKKQTMMIKFIEDFTEKNNMAPTVYEIARHFDIKTSTVFAHLRALQRKGQLVRSSKARSIVITKPELRRVEPIAYTLPAPLLTSDEIMRREDILVNSGLKAEKEYMQSLSGKETRTFMVHKLVAGRYKDLFAFRVPDDSLHEIGIFCDDIVIAAHDGVPHTGDIVVGLTPEGVRVRRYYYEHPAYFELRADDEKLDCSWSISQTALFGLVVALERAYF